MNSKDLSMIAHLDELIEAGIASIKIEGRVKSDYYLATTIRSYRMAIDEYYSDPKNYKFDPYYEEELKKVSHRDWTTGFFYGKAKEDSQVYTDNSYIRGYDYVGVVESYDEETKIATVVQKNRIFSGEEVEIFGPGKKHFTQKIEKMYDEDDNEIEVANKALQIYKFKTTEPVEEKYMIRRKSQSWKNQL